MINFNIKLCTHLGMTKAHIFIHIGSSIHIPRKLIGELYHQGEGLRLNLNLTTHSIMTIFPYFNSIKVDSLSQRNRNQSTRSSTSI